MEAMTRREWLRMSSLSLGAMYLAGKTGGGEALAADSCVGSDTIYCPGEPLDPNEMRITFCGTWYTTRPVQEANSIFVELGNGDSFIFDCGSGVVSNYVAMGIPFSRMDKIFLTHLHGDHTSDLFYIYCFGPASDRKTALNVFGSAGQNNREGVKAFCRNMKEMAKWHRESFSFLPTGYAADKKAGLKKTDGYDLVVKELPYMKNPGVAYENNGVKISHFPAVHARNGAISYKLEWNGLSMVFSGDTKPNNYMLENAKGVDVLIHEMTPSPEVWTTKQTGLTPADGDKYWNVVALNKEVQDSSHTLQSAYGYILSQTLPRLGVATHFPVDDDLIQPAKDEVACFFKGEFEIARDLMVINVSKTAIKRRMAQVPAFPWFTAKLDPNRTLGKSKYDGPYAQFNKKLLDNVIPDSLYSSCTQAKKPKG